jgi:hypothetical protein
MLRPRAYSARLYVLGSATQSPFASDTVTMEHANQELLVES